MTPTQTAHRFYCLLLEHFHHGHERHIVDSVYRQIMQELEQPKTGDND